MFVKPMYALAAALLAAPVVQGHYIFSQLIVNDQAVGGDYEYIRKNSNDYQPSRFELLNSEDLRCNKGALSSPASTYEAKAGDSIGAKLWNNEFIEHPGPGMIYMSKAPGAVSDYMGDGDWFKVWESGPENGPANVDTSWGTWQKDRMTFTIPEDIPEGEYLVRFEHVGIHENHVGKPQFYIECAQLSIASSGTGEPGPTVKIPGVYTEQDPAWTYSIWDGVDNGYTMPGPAVWSGGGSSGGASTSSASSSSGNSSSEVATGGSSSSGSSSAPSSGSSSGSSGSSSSTGSSSGASNPWGAPSSGSSNTGSNQWGAPASGSSTGGEMSASVPTTENTQAQGGAPATGGWGSWGGQSSGNTGGWAPQNSGNWNAQANTAEKRECDVEYVGGSAARARRAVRA